MRQREKNFDIQRNTRVSSGGQFTSNRLSNDHIICLHISYYLEIKHPFSANISISKIWECRMFCSFFWTNCQSFCRFLLKYKITSVILGNITPEFGKLQRKCNFFALILENFTPNWFFYTSDIRAICDKFHVWLVII